MSGLELGGLFGSLLAGRISDSLIASKPKGGNVGKRVQVRQHQLGRQKGVWLKDRAPAQPVQQPAGGDISDSLIASKPKGRNTGRHMQEGPTSQSVGINASASIACP